MIQIPFLPSGELDSSQMKIQLDTQAAAILVQSHNFFGTIERVKEIVALANSFETLVILCANPLSYGLLASPGELGADIAVGDLQPFGLALNYGGPYAGYMACKQAY